jgi:glycine dehydrogenase subunit 1
VNRRLLKNRIIGGLDLGRYYPQYAGHMLLCCTELRTREEISRLAAGMGGNVK